MKDRKKHLTPRRKLLRHLWQWIQVAPLPLTVTLLLHLLNAISRGSQPVLIAGFTNALINAQALFFWVGIYLTFITLTLLTDTFNPLTRRWFSNKAILHFQKRILQHSAQAPLIHFLDPDFHDTLNRATEDFSQRVVDWFESLLQNVQGVATIGTIFGAVLLIGGGIECVLILSACSIVTFLTRPPVTKLEVEQDRFLARPHREVITWMDILSNRQSGAEIRIFGIQHWLLSKWTRAYKKLAAHEWNTLKKITAWNVIATLFTIIGYCSIVFIAAGAAHNAPENEIAGVFTGLLSAATALQAHLTVIATSMGTLVKQSTLLRDLTHLLDPKNLPGENKRHTTTSEKDSSIEIDALSFTYPRTRTQTLKNITTKIKEGETIALVGKNGSGKTTLAYLLLGLYAPMRGTLRLSENNTRSKSAVFQNFVKFQLTVRDNVGFADVNRLHDDTHLQKTLYTAGTPLARELNTWLSPEFGGIDISGGEWLRIAIARGLFRASHLIVLDEPTASIDPTEEVKIVRELLRKKGGARTTIVISHRLGIARLCDRILVLDNGHLVENGTHEQLLATGGLYAKMWNTQASWYA